jgi:hypothetical protein
MRAGFGKAGAQLHVPWAVLRDARLRRAPQDEGGVRGEISPCSPISTLSMSSLLMVNVQHRSQCPILMVRSAPEGARLEP